MKDVIYICGPMTGLPESNYPAFHKAAAEWRAQGWTVVNTAEDFAGQQDLPYEVYMKNAVNNLVKCRAIALLPGWRNSRGAQMEVLIGERCGFEFFDANTGRPIRTPHPTIHYKQA